MLSWDEKEISVMDVGERFVFAKILLLLTAHCCSDRTFWILERDC